ncbi:MAG: autotransporter domain-containing protein [Synergistaceae bacterium]|nr:autotransporter domain-containing protein [Candidatus Equadaptatus faecalis]
MRSFKKTAAIFMLLTFIFATVSPAMAASGIVSGIVKGSGFSNIGDERTFAGYNWKLYAKDDTADASGNKYGYIITSDVMEKAKSDGTGSVTYQVFRTEFTASDAKKYSASELRKKVSGYQGTDTTQDTNSYEYQMKHYGDGVSSPADMTWEEANGGTGTGAKNYIVQHDMTKTGTDESPYGGCGMTKTGDVYNYPDYLYILSTAEAQALAGGTDIEKNILKASNYWWLRSPGGYDYYAADVSDDGIVGGYGDDVSYDFRAARPALQINLKSPIFQSNLFKTAAEGGKNLVTVGGGFSLPEVTDPTTLTKQTKETLTFTTPGSVSATSSTTDVTETVDSRIAGSVIDLTSPLLTSKQLKVSYSNFGTTTAQDHVAAVVSTGSGSTETYVNYAKLSTANEETNLVVDTSKLANGTEYNLYLFAEKIDGTNETPGDTTTPVADAATRLVNAGTFTLDNTYTNSGMLGSTHSSEALTASLGGDFNLSFEGGEYNTGVTVGANDNGTITADAASGTTLTGKITVEENATLATANKFTLKGDNTVDGTVTGDALTIADGTTTVGSTGSIENVLEITAGSLTANADSLKNNVSNSGIVNFTGGTFAKNYTSTGTTNFKGKTMFSGAVSLTNSTLGFYLDNFSKGDTIIDSANTINVAGTEIKLYQDIEGKKVEEEGDKLTLINNAEGYEGTKEKPLKKKVISTTGMLDYEYDTWLENNELVMGVKGDTPGPVPVIKDKTKSFSEARLGASAALNAAGDFVAGDVADSMDNTEGTASAGTQSAGGWGSFASIGGSRGRYNTGSHVDLNSFNVAAGLSKKIKDNVTLGIFVEGGNGRYTTYNEFEDGEVRADGDVNYFGGGVLAKIKGKKTAKGQLHGEASFRAGRMNSDYNSETVIPDGNTRFDTSNSYLGAHAGLGYKWALKNESNIDTYVKYLWSRQNSDTPTIAGKQFDLDAINSHRLRAGFRYNGKENENGVKFFGGLAYEYEFDGKAKGHMGEYSLLEPDFKGGSGMAELGIKYDKANSPWKVELGLTGYTGKRDSIGANLNAWYEFGK